MADGKHILIADDADGFRLVLANALTDAGYLVTQATNGKEAFELAAEKKPDMLVLDIKMPEMEGKEVLDNVRAEGSWGAEVPILMLSQLEDITQIADAISKKANGYLIKSENTTEGIVAEIEKYLQARPQ